MNMNFSKMDGLIPAIIQDVSTRTVLMLGFMNEEAYNKTKKEGLVTFYSRTREKLWTKGDESGNYLEVVDIKEDCDQDTLLIMVNPKGPVCHTGQDSCFGDLKYEKLDFLYKLQNILESRKVEMPEGSYTASLFKQGIGKIAEKVGEEAVECVIEALGRNDDLFLNECADLLFHMLILLIERGYKLEDVVTVLEDRHH